MIAETRERPRPRAGGSPSPIFAGRLKVIAVRRDTREKHPYVVTLNVVASASGEAREFTIKLDAADLLDFDRLRLRLRLATFYGLIVHSCDRDRWDDMIHEGVERALQPTAWEVAR